MPTAAYDVLADLADAVLAAAVEGITADGAELPARRFVHGGPWTTVAWDCELIAVSFDLLEPGGIGRAGGQRAPVVGQGAAPLTAVYTTQVVLCYPTVDREASKPTVPTAAEETAAARLLLAAGFSARRGVVDRIDDRNLTALQTDTPQDRRGIRYEQSEAGALQPNPRSPSGGMAAVYFQTRLRL